VYTPGFTTGQQTVENDDWVTGPSSCQAVGPSHRRGPLGCGPWAVGLLLAKPENLLPMVFFNRSQLCFYA